MRYPAKHKNETHRRIVKKAAQEFRGKGFEGIGIADLMSHLGLTHGGFYAHFRSKDVLVAEASVCSLEEAFAQMATAAESVPKDAAVTAIVDFYLSPQHRDNAERGCLLPALAAEIGRQPRIVRSAFTKALKGYIDRIARYMPGATLNGRRERAMLLLSGMAGTMLLARAMVDRDLSDGILQSARKFYSDVFGRVVAGVEQ